MLKLSFSFRKTAERLTGSALRLLALLLRIHEPVGFLHHALHILRLPPPYSPQCYGTGKTLLPFLQHASDLGIKQSFRHILTQEHELVPADAEDVPAAKMLEKQLAQGTDVFISTFMPEGVVDIFEIVEINEISTSTK